MWYRSTLPPQPQSGQYYFGTQTSPTSSCPRGHRRFASAEPANITVRNDSAMTAAKSFFAIYSPPLVIPFGPYCIRSSPNAGNGDARSPGKDRELTS